jgi:hypothetical protein
LLFPIKITFFKNKQKLGISQMTGRGIDSNSIVFPLPVISFFIKPSAATRFPNALLQHPQ